MITTTLRKLSEYTARGISPKYVETNGLMVLNQKCIRNQKIDFSPARLTDVNKKFAPSKKIKLHDILINSTGVGTLGRVAQVSKELNATVDSHITIFRSLDYSKELDIKICKKYIGYALREKEKEIEALGKGATGQTELSKNSVLDNIEIRIPKEFEKQNEIASVLAVYDDLMENNEKRIKILEEMAQLLYAEWFVKFKFPGHEKVKMIDSRSKLGIIPEGWEVKKLGNKINISKGKNITKNIIVDGDVPVVAGGLSPAYYHDTPNTSAPVVTVSASGANSGFVNLYQVDIWASDCSYIDSGITPYVYYYYLFLKNNQTNITNMQRGSAQPHVYPKDLMQLLILDVPDGLVKEFELKASLMFDEIGNLNKQNIKLSNIRDLLISQLVTGKRELK